MTRRRILRAGTVGGPGPEGDTGPRGRAEGAAAGQVSDTGGRAPLQRRSAMNKSDAAAPGRAHESAPHGDAPGAKERVTVNLTGRGAGALSELVRRTGDSKTDVINRALSVYELIERITDEGGAVFVREKGSAELERVRFL